MIVDTATFGGVLTTGFGRSSAEFGSLSDSTFRYFGRIGRTSASSTPAAVDTTYTMNTLWVVPDSTLWMSVIDQCCPIWLPIARDRWVLKWGSAGEYLLRDLDPTGIREYRSLEKLPIGWQPGDTVALKILELNRPSAPRLQAKGISGTQIDLSWEVDRTGGSDITGYKIEVSTDGMTFTDLVVDTASTATTYSHTGLSANDTVYYKVSVTNAIGTSDASDVASATAEDSPPGVVRAEVNTNARGVQLFFDEGLNLLSLPDASTFTVMANGTELSLASVSQVGLLKEIVITLTAAERDIRPGETVTVSYTKPSTNPLQDAAGVETPSFTDFPVTNNLPPIAPDAPGDVGTDVAVDPAYMGASNGAFSLHWTEPHDGGDAITKYQFRTREQGGSFGSWTDIALSDVSDQSGEKAFEVQAGVGGSYTLLRNQTSQKGTTWEKTYDVELRAVNSVDNGTEASATVSTVAWWFELELLNDSIQVGDTGKVRIHVKHDGNSSIRGLDGAFDVNWSATDSAYVTPGSGSATFAANREYVDVALTAVEDSLANVQQRTVNFELTSTDQGTKMPVGDPKPNVDIVVVFFTAPAVSSVEITSSPQSGFGFYRRNEVVEATVTFDTAVDVTGAPELELDFAGAPKAAACAAATNTTTMVCSYTVALGDSAPDGIAIAANKLTGGTITATGSTVAADLDHAAVPTDAGHKVDAIRPTLVTTGADAPTTTTDGTKVILTFSEDIRPVNRSRITIQANGVTLSTTAADRSGNKAEITLAAALTAAATNITVSLASSAVFDIARNGILFVAATAVANAVPPPPAPNSLKARRGDGEVHLEWVPAAADTTHPDLAFQLRYGAEGGEYNQWRDIPGSAPGGPNERSHTVTGLENGTRYAFELRVRRAGSGFGRAAEIRQTPEAPRWSVSTNRRSVHEGEDVTLGIATRNAVGFYSAAEPLTLAVIGRIVLDSDTIDGADPEDYEIWVDGAKVRGYMKDITFLNFDSDPDRDPFPAEHFDLEVPVGSASLDVTVKVLVDDDEEEGQEHMSFMVFREDSLVNDTWAETGVNIESGDAGVVKQLAVADAEATEGEDPSLDFVVTLAPAADWTVEVDYATHDGTARAGADYTDTSGTLTFLAGETEKTVSVPVIDDTVEDTPETLTLRLSNEDPEYDTTNVDWGSEEAGVLVVDSVATGTIRNTEDQAEPPLSADFPESAYTSKAHTGSDDRPQVVVAFSVAVAGFDKNTPSVSVTGASGLSVQAHAEDGLENAYVFFMTPDGDGDVTFALVADAACASGGICTAGGTELTQVPAALTIPGPSADPSSLSVADAEATEEEDSTMDFVVTLAPAASDAVTVDYATADGTAAAGEDYAATSGTLTFQAGDTTKTISVPIVDDAADDGGETFTLSLGNASGGVLGDAEATGTILDDDNAVPLTASFSDMPASHAGEDFTFGLAFSEEVEVGYATLRDTAFVVTGGEVSQALRRQQGSNRAWNITVDPDGQGAVTITLPETTDCDAVDAICTGDGRPLSHSLSSVVAGPVIIPTVSVSDASAAEGDAVAFTVSLSAASSQQVTVEYATSDGTAASGTDYTAESGTLTFAANETTKTVSVATTDDSVDENDETFTLTLSSPANATLGDAAATGTIEDDDSPPVLSVSDASAAEGDAVEFTVSLSAASAQQVTVEHATSDGTAASGTDYTAESGTLTFAANETTKTVSVATTDDSVDEEDETFTLTLSSATNATLGDATATGMIEDDDSPPVLSVSDASAAEGDAVAFTVSLSAASSQQATVDYATSDGTAASGTDYTAESGTLTFAANETTKTVSVATTDDSVDENDETFTLTLSSATNATLGDATATGTINDDDESLPTVSVSDASAAEGDAVAFAVSLSSASSQQATVEYATSDGTATSGTDFTTESGTLTFAANETTKTVSVATTDDSVDENDETFTLTLSNPANATLGDATATGTINDNDNAAPLTASFSDMPASHAGEEFTFGLAFSENVELSYATLRDTALVVTGGEVKTAQRQQQGSNRAWNITVEPDGQGAVAIELPETTDCDASGAICTDDERPLSHSLSATVAGPVIIPAVSVSDASAAEGDAVAFAVSLSAASSQQATVEYATSDGTATSGTDYTAESGTLTFAANETTKTVSVATTDDSVDEDNETFTLTLSSPANATLGDATATGTINDNDVSTTPLTASFSDMPASHTGEEFTFGLAFSENVELSYVTLRDTALVVTGGEVKTAQRQQQGSNQAWNVTVEPDSATDTVTVTLPETTDCDAADAICTHDDRPLSHSLSATVVDSASASAGDSVGGDAADDPLALLDGLTPDEAAEALFGERRLGEARLEALDRLGNRNGRYDLGDLLSWIERCRRGEARCGTDPADSGPASAAALLGAAAAGRRRASKRPGRRDSGRGGRRPVQGMRRRARMAGYALAMLFAATMAWSCTDDFVGPPAAGQGPGFLTVEWTGPADARDIGVLLELEGPGIEAVRAPGLDLYESSAPGRHRIIVAGSLRAGALVQFRAPDRGRPTLYRVRILQVTGEDYGLRDVGEYRAAIAN